MVATMLCACRGKVEGATMAAATAATAATAAVTVKEQLKK
jgi:hypothetical protein